MNTMHLDIWIAIIVGTAMPVAMFTDVSARRIPNFLTFPLLGAAITARILFQGWPGIVLALAGAVLAPLVLLLLHGGRGLGMGDLKLAAGVGAAFGPITAVVSMLATALIGGLLALVWMLKPGGFFADMLLMSVPGLSRLGYGKHDDDSDPMEKVCPTMPYGVAIGLGAFLVLAVRLSGGHDVWFL